MVETSNKPRVLGNTTDAQSHLVRLPQRALQSQVSRPPHPRPHRHLAPLQLAPQRQPHDPTRQTAFPRRGALSTGRPKLHSSRCLFQTQAVLLRPPTPQSPSPSPRTPHPAWPGTPRSCVHIAPRPCHLAPHRATPAHRHASHGPRHFSNVVDNPSLLPLRVASFDANAVAPLERHPAQRHLKGPVGLGAGGSPDGRNVTHENAPA